uniref:C-type lectin domain-containing protein n=1 Tax=Oryzias latipes TaxID=8090 RepID=A0A3P9HS93_ORYLA
MSHWAEAPGKTQDTLERPRLSAGLGTPRGPPRGAGGSGWGEGSLGISAQSAGPATRSRISGGRWMDGWILCCLSFCVELYRFRDGLINGVSSAGVSSDFWIGLYNQIHWRWSDGFTGKGADYRNWNRTDSDPDFISAKQFCVNIGDGGEWWDRSCGNNFTFICYRGKNIIAAVCLLQPR